MRKILIVGAGQAGLQLALSLQAEGYDVTVMSARTADEIRNGWPTSTQVMMYRALDRERDAKLNLWDGMATPIVGIGFNLSPAPGVSAFSFSGAWARPGTRSTSGSRCQPGLSSSSSAADGSSTTR